MRVERTRVGFELRLVGVGFDLGLVRVEDRTT